MANQVLFGFHQLKDIFTESLTGDRVVKVNEAIVKTVAEHNRQMNASMRLFTQVTDKFKVRYKTPMAARLQPLDENGRARPIKQAGHYDVAFPIQEGGLAWGGNFISREKMTVEDANNLTNTLITADRRWLRDHLLAALFVNTPWQYTDEENGLLTIKGPANGDSDTYLIMTGADAGAADNHFLAQAGSISDAANPFPAIYEELTEHPENDGEVIVLVPTANKSAVQGLAGFVKARRPNDPIQPGDDKDVLVGDLNMDLPGKLFGYVDDCWVVEWSRIPTDYLVGVTSNGEPPLAMRQHPQTSLQGFQKVAERNDHPFYESQWVRYAGFGAWNRVGVVVQRVGNATYTVPTNYTSPMP